MYLCGLIMPKADAVLVRLEELAGIVQELKADKDRRDTDKAHRIEALHNEIIAIFKRQGTPLDEIMAVLEVTKHHVTAAYIESRRGPALATTPPEVIKR